MNGALQAGRWIAHFRRSAADPTGRRWPQPPTPASTWPGRRALLRSLAIFQLGEEGGGTRIRRYVDARIAAGELPEGYREALDLFIAEEQLHAQTLGRLIDQLGGQRLRRHPSNSAFRHLRNTLGLGFNLQVLLIAELIAEAYYGALAEGCPQPAVQAVCRRILRDEVAHIRFHADFFQRRARRRLPLHQALWEAQFQILFVAAQLVVWSGHGAALKAAGCPRTRFMQRSARACIRFLGQARPTPRHPARDPLPDGPAHPAA